MVYNICFSKTLRCLSVSQYQQYVIFFNGFHRVARVRECNTATLCWSAIDFNVFVCMLQTLHTLQTADWMREEDASESPEPAVSATSYTPGLALPTPSVWYSRQAEYVSHSEPWSFICKTFKYKGNWGLFYLPIKAWTTFLSQIKVWPQLFFPVDSTQLFPLILTLDIWSDSLLGRCACSDKI